MESLGRTDHRRGERRVTGTIGVAAEPIVREWVNVIRRTQVRDGIRRYPLTRAWEHSLRGVRVLQAPLVRRTLIINVGGGQTSTPTDWLRLEEAEVGIVLHPIGVGQLRVRLHGDMERRGSLELTPGSQHSVGRALHLRRHWQPRGDRRPRGQRIPLRSFRRDRRGRDRLTPRIESGRPSWATSNGRL